MNPRLGAVVDGEVDGMDAWLFTPELAEFLIASNDGERLLVTTSSLATHHVH